MPKGTRKITDKDRIERFNKVVTPYLRRLGISSQWNILLAWGDDDDFKNTEDEDAAGWPASGIADASCTLTYPYRDVRIQFRRSAYDKHDDRQLLRVGLHEVFHRVLTGHGQWLTNTYMRKSHQDEYDRMVEGQIEQVIEWLLSIERSAPCCHEHKTRKPRRTSRG